MRLSKLMCATPFLGVALLLSGCNAVHSAAGSGSSSSTGTGTGSTTGTGSSTGTGSTTPSTVGDWTWMGGGGYGVVDQAPTPTWPGPMQSEAAYSYNITTWTDSTGHLWLFGGGLDSNRYVGGLNALWQLTPSSDVANITFPLVSGSITFTPTELDEPTSPYIVGVWGTEGVAAPSNVPSGRYGAVTWTDASGNLWLFGGFGMDAAGNDGEWLNDLWKYSPSTGEWTWMSGSSSGHTTGVYGTLGVAAPGNTPGDRSDSSTWTDASGNLWLFGGYGLNTSSFGAGMLNDLWKYSPSTNEWTWMGGPQTQPESGTTGVYGTLGVASASNMPGSREDAASWTDPSGNLWLYGGYGVGSTSVVGTSDLGALADVWKYSPSTGEWTWMSGPDTSGNSEPMTSVTGTKGVAAASNTPGYRVLFGWAADPSGNLWLYGGGGAYPVNDLWEYNITTNEWTWMSGTQTEDEDGTSGVYGTEGVPAASNIPTARFNSAMWFDSTGNLWLFGGTDTYNGFNDLWQYQVQ